MNKYFIEVPHGADKQSCKQAIRVFLETGSHFLSHAEWGCLDAEHKAWILVDTESKEEARNIISPAYRDSAKIIQLTTFKSTDFLEPEKYHK